MSTSSSRLGWGRWKRLAQKELREILRDRRTIITLVLMPLLVYPLLSVTFNKFLITYQPSTSQELVLGVSPAEHREAVRRFLVNGYDLLRQREQPNEAPDEEFDLEDPNMAAGINLVGVPDVRLLVDSGDLLAGIHVRVDADDETRQPALELVYREGEPSSTELMRLVERRLGALNDFFLQRRLARHGLSPAVPAPTQRLGIAKSTSASVSLAMLLPLILILMTITGAVYPAIDLTAGERERGTLEALIASPVPRQSLLFAKYVAVLTVALMTAAVNLTAMTITLMTSGLGPVLFGNGGLDFQVVAHVFGLTILFAAFFSAVLLAVTSFARSFKEAQAYLIPLMLLSISPGVLSLMPELTLNGPLAVTPLINIVLLARTALEGDVSPLMSLVVVLSTAMYAGAAIAIAARIFGTDAILYASQGSWSDLILRPHEQRDVPTLAEAVAAMALIFPSYFIAGNLAAYFSDLSMQRFLWFNAAATFVVFALIPMVLTWLRRLRWTTTYRLHVPPPLALVGALVLALSLWPFAHELFRFAEWIGFATLEQNTINQVRQMLEKFGDVSPALILFGMAVVAPVCEELFFRGFLLSALLKQTRPWKAILLSGLLFGLFHMVTPKYLATERLLPSTFLGLVLAWVCYRSGSLWPSILLHVGHNGLLLTTAIYRDQLKWLGDVGDSTSVPMPPTWLAAAGIGAVIGLTIIHFAQRPTYEGVGSERVGSGE